jgi:hypothetical protein
MRLERAPRPAFRHQAERRRSVAKEATQRRQTTERTRRRCSPMRHHESERNGQITNATPRKRLCSMRALAFFGRRAICTPDAMATRFGATRDERHIKQPLNERSPMLSHGSASHPESVRKRTKRRLNAEARHARSSDIQRRRHREPAERPSRRAAADHTTQVMRPAPIPTPRAASVLRTERRLPSGKPFRPQADSR